ncbi:MAG: hypothetical protein AB1772_04435 [Candidatus Zixiibacteriota bacterium]
MCSLWLAIASGPAAQPSDERPSRDQAAAAGVSPAYCTSIHDVGRIAIPITNAGYFGRGHDGLYTRDCFTGRLVSLAEYPKRSYAVYLSTAALWVGAVVERDTLVSTGDDGVGRSREFHPAEAPYGNLIYRSTLDPTSPRFEGAVSEQDYIAVYSDTCTHCPGVRTDIVDSRPHRPLNIEVIQRSYSWSYSYAQDFVLFDYDVKNIGRQRLREMYIGLFVDGDVFVNLPISNADYGRDDLCGFREYQPAFYMDEPCPPDSDLVNLAWVADNDGDLTRPQEYARLPHITGARIISTPNDSLRVSFNWWSTNRFNPGLDFGPQARVSYRDLGFNNLGTPWGDRNAYHFLRNGEHDYDQAMIGTIGFLDPTWVSPPFEFIDSVVAGLDSRYLLSFGPFALDPGQTLPLTFAYVGGANFHRDPDNLQNLPDYPELWYENVHFDSLTANATWAGWVYDNPGFDTDSDGYAGEFTICNLSGDSTIVCDTLIDTSAEPDTDYVQCRWEYAVADTVWRTGDGIPDFRGAGPPPNPSTYTFVNGDGDTVRGLRVFPEVGSVRLVWNGVMSETTPDPFTHEYDFEGYRVYIARDDRESSYSVIDSYDRENYNRWIWNGVARRFVLRDPPFSLQQLRCLYGDSCGDTTWHPENYPRTRPLVISAGPKYDPLIYYFEPQDYNRSVMIDDGGTPTTRIRKVYPHSPRPPYVDPDSIRHYFPDRDDTLYFTEDGYLKYYEYEYVFDGLLPTVAYYVNVTAFDFGFPELDLPGLETNPSLLPKIVYPLASSDAIAAQGLQVYVYPNPYRLDGDYRDNGYEARGRLHIPEDKTRLVHFANLPPKCTISIFSLDGDLVRELQHDVDPDDYLANHATWDLINRNAQLVVSGMYYWVVEADDGATQIGKLVVIM